MYAEVVLRHVSYTLSPDEITEENDASSSDNLTGPTNEFTKVSGRIEDIGDLIKKAIMASILKRIDEEAFRAEAELQEKVSETHHIKTFQEAFKSLK